MLDGQSLLDKNGNVIDPERVMQIPGLWLGAGVAVISKDEANFDVSYVDADGKGVCDIEFETSISPKGEKRLFIDDMTSSGIGTKAFSKLLDLAKRLGVDRIELAARDVGGYFWARLGFLPENPKWLITDDEEKMSFSSPDEFRELVASRMGKNLFVNSDWNGFLDLNDPKQMEFMQKYIDSKLSVGSPQLV